MRIQLKTTGYRPSLRRGNHSSSLPEDAYLPIVHYQELKDDII
ncbi:hypothetical protein AM1_4720 [Acaryochloris marina MBIC11017]|uniref:Uncharacterized protein n=1 Tax=Acaryochloris marina (strain MBIC 11017) TaxID=329726 RepID=B0C1F7_ACAM1|nr:hypothetical protein AM1_4720 [Acaryochloris marina MBIC11017]